MNLTAASDQTRKIRDRINLKIKELGDKYFQVKAVFDQLNLHRDHLFLKGKELEELFKDHKEGLHLQTQSCRMKEALYCWYAEHFYNEIFEMGPIFLSFLQKEVNDSEYQKKKKVIEPSKNNKSSNTKKLEVKQRSYKEKPQKKSNGLNISQQNRKPKQDKQVFDSIDDQQTEIVQTYLPPPQHVPEILTEAHQMIQEIEVPKENNQNQFVQQLHANPVISDANYVEDNDNNNSCIDDIFHNSFDEIDIMSPNNNIYFDYNDIFYYQQ